MANSIVALTDTASQVAELQRRQKLAEALSAQGAAPIEVQSYKGIQAPISPFSALAKVLQTYLGAKQSADAIKGEKEARKTAREEAVGFLQNLDKTATPNLAAPTGAPEMINTGVPTADFTPYVPTAKENAAAKDYIRKPVAPVPTAPIMQAPGVDGSMADAPMVRAVPGLVDNGPARMPMANAPSIQAPQLYGNEQAPVEVNTPQQKMAMLMQAQMSGNPYLEQMAPALYGEAKGEAKAKKVFDAIGDVSKEYGGDPRIMAGIVAAGDPNAGIDYLMKLGASNATAKQEMAKLEFTTRATAAEHRIQAQERSDDRQAQRDLTLQIAQMGNDTRRDLAAAIAGKGPKITGEQRRAASLAYRALEGNNRLNDLAKQGIYAPSTPFDSLFKRDKNGLTTIVFKSDQDRKYIQAFKEFIAPILRLDSGAAVPDSEVESYMQTYGNKFEDSPQVRWQKAQGRTAAIRATIGMGRPAYEEEYGAIPEFQVLTDPRGRPVAPSAPKPVVTTTPATGRPLTDAELLAKHSKSGAR